MQSQKRYRRYPDLVKSEIAKTGNIYLFPEMQIPRTTAQHWVKKKKPFSGVSSIQIESVFKRKSEFLEKELTKEKSMRTLLETVRKIFPFDFRTKKLRNKLFRNQIILAIKDCLKCHSLADCLNAIGLTKCAYQLWASQLPAEKVKSPCHKRSISTLTAEEIFTMRKFVTSKKYAHIPLNSLHLLAQKLGELFCSLDSWYKYCQKFAWKRPWTMEKRVQNKIGIRAQKPNEIWHLDVTVVDVRPGHKLYIQAVIDNFSRYVLAWRVTDKVNAENTIESIKLAHQKARALLNENSAIDIFMDPGKENNNHEVQRFVSSKNLRRVLAQVDIHFSNSMVERLFHSLKKNFLYHQKINGIEDLTRKANFYFNQYNNFIPMQIHRGGTPAEIFQSKWTNEAIEDLSELRKHAVTRRKEVNKSLQCSTCPAKELPTKISADRAATEVHLNAIC